MICRPMSHARRISSLLVLLAVVATPAVGHEVRPAYLEMVEDEPSRFSVLWKQPMLGDRILRLDPIFPAHCSMEGEPSILVEPGALLERSVLVCEPEEEPLEGHVIKISGLERTLTDVLLRLDLQDGTHLTQLIRPEQPEVTIERDSAPGPWAYFYLGIEHLVFGFDHILFVLGLVFFVRKFTALLGVITAFTVAHSITLALATLAYVRLPQAAVEAVIALTILYLAVELLQPVEKRSTLLQRHPWSVAFGFGLLHGFGFAGALAEIGLPRDATAIALLLFNVGLEVAQILVVLPVVGLLALTRRRSLAWPQWITAAPVYGMGTVASYWFISRVVALW